VHVSCLQYVGFTTDKKNTTYIKFDAWKSLLPKLNKWLIGWRRESRLEQLVRYFLTRLPRGVAYCLTKPGLALIQCKPHRSAVQRPATWLTLLQRQPGDLVTSICFGSHVSATDTLTLLIKASATVTVYRRHRRILLPARVNSLFVMCIGIIRNNSLVDGRARAESNPGHWARHALLHMAAECVNRSATKASPMLKSIE